MLDPVIVHVAHLSDRFIATQVCSFLVAIKGGSHVAINRVAVLVQVAHQVLGILDVFVTAQRQSKPARTLKEIVTFVKFTLALIRYLVVQVCSIDHGWTVA